MNVKNGLEFCKNHRQETNQSHFDKHNCDFCKLEAEVERLRAEIQRLDIAGTHSCHDDCPKLPCVQRREIERLRAELAAANAGLAMVEATVAENELLRAMNERLATDLAGAKAELAAAKAAGECLVEVESVYVNPYREVVVSFEESGTAQRFADWVRKMKERGEG
jgi:hypothetical protein